MKLKKIVPYVIIIGIVFVFFFKTVFLGKIPFPGDLLLTSYAPWRHVSYFGYVAGAIPSKDQYFDVIRELYPWKTEVIHQIKEFTIPLWNPYSFSGAPLLANYQSQVLYPLGVLYLLLPQIVAWTLLVLLQPILGGIFTFIFATSIGISIGGALIVAIAFNFSSFANVWMEFNTVWHTILWLPLLLYLLEKGVQNKKLTLFQQLIFIFALFSSITGGHPQDFINSFLFFILYAIFRITTVKNWNLRQKLIFVCNPLSIITVISFLLAAPQLLPTIELFKNSARVPHDFQFIIEKMLFQPWQAGLMVVQELFGNPATKTNFLNDTYVGKAISIGIIGFFLSLFSMYSLKRNTYIKFFLISIVGLLLFTFNTPLSGIIHRYPIPILSTGTPTRILFLFCFAFSILAGFGFDVLITMKKFIWKPIVVIGIIMAFLWGFTLFHPQFPGLTYTELSFITMKKAMFFSSGLLLFSIFLIFISTRKRIFLYGLIILLSGELFYGFIKFNPFVPKNFIYPDNQLLTFFKDKGGIDRIWGYGTAQIEANFTTQYQLFSTDGTDPLNLKWYNEFIQSSKDGNITSTFNRTTRSDALLFPGYGEKDLPNNLYRLRMMDSLGVKYIIDRTENPKDNLTFPKDRFLEIWHKDDWTVYENIKASPRYFLTDTYSLYETPEEFESKFFDLKTYMSTTILLNKEDSEHIPALSPGPATIELITYKANTVQFKTHSDSNKLLYLSDTYDTGWKSFIDDTSTHIYRANWAFRTIVVPPGDHIITFSYQPRSFLWGILFMLLGLGLMIVIIVLGFISKYTHQNTIRNKNSKGYSTHP